MNRFVRRLRQRWASKRFLCIGLDLELSKVRHYISRDKHPDDVEAIVIFARKIIEATYQYAAAYKINLAFTDAIDLGDKALRLTIERIREYAPDMPIILDGKRQDIGNSMQGYVEMLKRVDGDALTSSPWMGEDAIAPLLDEPDVGAILLCRTSNPGAESMQDVLVLIEPYEMPGSLSLDATGASYTQHCTLQGYLVPHYQRTAWLCRQWNEPTASANRGNIGLVVGATAPEQLRIVREIIGDNQLILIPGVGAQGGDLEASVQAGMDSHGSSFLINVSRAIVFAGKPGEDQVHAAHDAVKYYHEAIQAAVQHRLTAAN